MSQRNKDALTCQGGASNERRVAAALVSAIDECRADCKDPREDPAVFLILHQLTFLLTGQDTGPGSRWLECMNKVRAACGEAP